MDNLTTDIRLFKIGGVEYKFAPLNLLALSRLATFFKGQGMTYEQALNKIWDNDDVGGGIKATIDFLGVLLEGDIDSFKKNMLKLKDRNELISVVIALLQDQAPEYTFTEKKSLKRNIMGWIIIVLAIVGLIHTLDYANTIIGEVIPSFWDLLKSKFNF